MKQEETLHELCQRLGRVKINTAWNLCDVHFFYIDEKYSLFLSKDGASHQEESISGYSSVKNLGFERGELLETFSKLEFLVNECLKVHFLGLGTTKDFDYLTEYVDLSYKVKTLYNEGLITNSIAKTIPNIMFVRNQIAHRWLFKDILYQQKDLEDYDHFVKFKGDLEQIFSEIIKTYHVILNINNVEEYVKGLIHEIKSHS